MKKEARDVFKYREEIFNTQNIWHDKELDDVIASDMGYIWDIKGGQDGMYDAFPFSFSRRSIIRESDYYNDYLKSNCHYKTELIRSYVLDGGGGIAIIIEREHYHYDNEDNVRCSDGYRDSQKIVTLGEDDGYHFFK